MEEVTEKVVGEKKLCYMKALVHLPQKSKFYALKPQSTEGIDAKKCPRCGGPSGKLIGCNVDHVEDGFI